MRGLPFSGKTSWTESQIGKKPNTVRVSWTDILRSISSKEYTLNITHLAIFAATSLAKQALSKGMTVYLDEENLYGPSVSLFIRDAEMLNVKIEYHIVKCSVEKAKKNCIEQGGSSSDLERIELLAAKYEELLELKR